MTMMEACEERVWRARQRAARSRREEVMVGDFDGFS